MAFLAWKRGDLTQARFMPDKSKNVELGLARKEVNKVFFDPDVGTLGKAHGSYYGRRLENLRVPVKYWRFRRQLFSKFEMGIRFDVVGFQAAKSEPVADFVAKRLPGERVLDAFTGIGGSALGFARAGKQVVSIEIVKERSEMAAHNAKIYGLKDQITFVSGNTLELWKQFDFDAAYFDPAWGGVGYERFKSLNFSSLTPNVLPLLKAIAAQGKHIALTVPLNFDLNELKQIPREVQLFYNDQYRRPYCVHCVWIGQNR